MSLIMMVIMLILALPLVAISGFFLIWALKVARGETGREIERLRAQEAGLIQEIHQGLARMEKRIEALETILLDPDGKEEKK